MHKHTPSNSIDQPGKKTTSNQNNSHGAMEKMALQNDSFTTGLAREFLQFDPKEKILIIALIFTALSESINESKRVSSSTGYCINLKILNDYLLQDFLTPSKAVLFKPMTHQDLVDATDAIFHRAVSYHYYNENDNLGIVHTRLIPSYRHATTGDATDRTIEINIGHSLMVELNSILDQAKGSLPKALALSNDLLSPCVKNIKTVN